MKDRIPQYPGRVKMTMPDGTIQYVTLERADEPIQVGTPLNKQAFLKDETCALLELPDTAVPDDAFKKLAPPKLLYSETVAGTASYTVPSDGSVTKLLVAIIGGGGSGAIWLRNANYTSTNYTSSGSSGRAQVSIIDVTPGQVLSGIVGAGGAGVGSSSATSFLLKNGSGGGSTSFGDLVANGGNGGVTSSGNAATNFTVYGGQSAPSPNEGSPYFFGAWTGYTHSQAQTEIEFLLSIFPASKMPFCCSVPKNGLLTTSASTIRPRVKLPNEKYTGESKVVTTSSASQTYTIKAPAPPTDPGGAGGALTVLSDNGSTKFIAFSGSGADGGVFVYDYTGR